MTDDKSYGRSKAGVELTDKVLDRMADEAEAGLDLTKLRRRPGRPAMGSGPADTLPVRLDPELREALDQRAADGAHRCLRCRSQGPSSLPRGELTAAGRRPPARWRCSRGCARSDSLRLPHTASEQGEHPPSDAVRRIPLLPRRVSTEVHWDSRRPDGRTC